MSTAIVTIDSGNRSLDLVVPLEVPIGDLALDIAREASASARIDDAQRWVVGKRGSLPITAERTLSDEGVVDGAILYLADAYATPPTGYVFDTVPPELLDDAPAAEPVVAGFTTSDALESDRPLLRGGIEPSVPLLGPPIFLVTIVALWLAFRTPAPLGRMGVPAAVVVVVVGLLLARWFGVFRLLRERRNTPHNDGAAVPDGAPSSGPKASHAVPTRPSTQLRLGDDAQRTARVYRLVEDLVYDLGRWLGGESPELAYAAPGVTAFLGRMVAPIRDAGERVEPDFGGWVDVSIEWGSGPAAPVHAHATFEDRSKRLRGDGEEIPRASEMVTVNVTIDPFLSSIRAVGIAAKPAR